MPCRFGFPVSQTEQTTNPVSDSGSSRSNQEKKMYDVSNMHPSDSQRCKNESLKENDKKANCADENYETRPSLKNSGR